MKLINKAVSKLLAAALIAVAPAMTVAQEYPNKPVRVVIPYPPGGPTDILGRLVAQRLTERLGQSFVVENRPGASGMIGSDSVAKAAPDGYTLLINASLHVINPSLYSKMPHDPIEDFAPISQIADVPLVLVVNKDNPAQNVADIIKMAKETKGGLTFASSGNGAAPHLAGEAFNAAVGTEIAHVPYKGSAPALTDVIGGHVTMMFDSLPSSTGFIANGTLRPLAVTTANRVASLPDVPTVQESGVPGFEISTWYGVWAPAGTPEEILNKLGAEIHEIVHEPEIAKRIGEMGSVPVGSMPKEFAAYNLSEKEKFAKIVELSGARLD